MKIVINSAALAALHGVKVGAVMTLETKQGVPVSREWRNRLKDAKIDKCVEVVKTTPKSKKDAK